MDIEKLNKSQVVLLTLLVSFVTSIATGIVTVSLMEDAPQAITQTVNRIVERTVEKVVPAAIAGTGEVAAATNVVTEKIVTVSESDQIAQAVQVIESSVVRLYTRGKDETGKDADIFVGLAIVKSDSGVLLADVSAPDSNLSVHRHDGVVVPAFVIARPKDATTIEIQAATTTEVTVDGAKETKTLEWKPVAFASTGPRLGQTVVAIGGRASTRLAEGIITATSGESETNSGGGTLETNIGNDEYSSGSPLMNVRGEVIGLGT